MTPYGNDVLVAMLADLESDRVERKESFKGNAPQTVREAVCAFANDLAGHDGHQVRRQYRPAAHPVGGEAFVGRTGLGGGDGVAL